MLEAASPEAASPGAASPITPLDAGNETHHGSGEGEAEESEVESMAGRMFSETCFGRPLLLQCEKSKAAAVQVGVCGAVGKVGSVCGRFFLCSRR